MRYLEFYSKRIPTPLPAPSAAGEVVVPCVFHADQNPSLGINLESGKWRCYTPACAGSRGGGWKKFESMLAGEVPGAGPRVAPISEDEIVAYNVLLLRNRERMEYLAKKRGLTQATVERFLLGWDSERFWIPVRDAAGAFVNVRKYKPDVTSKKEMKMLPYAGGYNQARIFPVENLQGEWVLLLEGEMDTLLACQMGYPAATGTGGAGTWTEEFTRALEGKDVVLCYDCDKDGREGAARAAVRLLGRARSVRRIDLPLQGTKDSKDFTDYVVKMGHSKEDFDALLDAAQVVEQKVSDRDAPPEGVERIHLSAIGDDRLVGKRVSTTVLVAGRDLAPFVVPFRVSYKCEMGEKICDGCGIARAGGQRDAEVPPHSPDLLAMAGVPDREVDVVLARLAGVPGRCRKYRAKVTEHANLEQFKAIPEIDFDAEDGTYAIRSLYFLGSGIQANRTYDLEAVPMPDPKTQYATALVTAATESRDCLEKYELTPEDLAALAAFRAGAA